MGASIAITRTDMSAKGLRELAARTKDACSARRMLAIALVLDGADRTSAARSCGMDRQTLRDWVHRYNYEGVDGAGQSQGAWRELPADAGAGGHVRPMG